MKVEDNHYKYRIETKDSNGSVIDFVDIDTVEPLRCAYDVQDELNLETNEHIKRVEEIILNADSTEFWYVDEDRSTDTHLVCYFEEVQLMANANHPMVDTDRSLFEYGKINANEYQDTNFICTHVMPNGVSRIYMSIDKDQLLYQVFTNETIKEYIAQNPITIWYAIRYPVAIPRSMSKGHLLTLDGQTDVSISTNGDCGLPLVKFNIGDKEYNMDNNPIHLSSTTEGTQIRNIMLEGNTPINFARGNGVNTTEATSNTRYDFAPFYDGQTTIQGTVEGGYVSAKLYGDTMVNIAKPYGETPLLTVTNASTLCDDLLGANEEGVVLADGEITEGRIVGNSLLVASSVTFKIGNLSEANGVVDTSSTNNLHTEMMEVPSRTFSFYTGRKYTKIAYYNANRSFISCQVSSGTETVVANIPSNAKYVRYGVLGFGGATVDQFTWKYEDGTDVYTTIQSVVNPTVISSNMLNYFMVGNVEQGNGSITTMTNQCYSVKMQVPTSKFTFTATDMWSKIAYYGENDSFIRCDTTGGVVKPITSIPPANAKYVRYGQQITSGNLSDIFGATWKYEDGADVYPELQTIFTSTHTLNKLPNGVADYIDVVNKVHVQRTKTFSNLVDTFADSRWMKHSLSTSNTFTGRIQNSIFREIKRIGLSDKDFKFVESYGNPHYAFIIDDVLNISLPMSSLTEDSLNAFKVALANLNPTFLCELATPIYTPLTNEEIAQLPLSAYKDGYINLSSDQLTPSFEFRMKASNRYQVDMLETGYYYLNAPVGNVKLGTANVDVQQMPCIVKVDNVGSGDSRYRLGFDGGETIYIVNPTGSYGYWVDDQTGELKDSSAPEKQFLSDFIEIDTNISSIVLVDDGFNKDVSFWDENKAFVKRSVIHNNRGVFKATIPNQPFKFIRIGSFDSSDLKARAIINPITLAKLPSHRIPTIFTQGMKCGTDFGYWEGIKYAKPTRLRTANLDGGWSVVESSGINDGLGIELNGIEITSASLIIEDELDIATGKLTKRVGKVVFDGSSDESWVIATRDNFVKTVFFRTSLPSKSRENYVCISNRIPYVMGWGDDFERLWIDNRDRLLVHTDKAFTIDDFRKYLASNPIIVYYPLEVPEISYPNISLPQVKTVAKTQLECTNDNGYLKAQVKPSHLTYPVPSLVGNRTYTVVHNRKNISGSTKPIELNLGGTVVQLNDASSKTLVKTPSTLVHSNLIFIGGESTVDHVMVLDGDWTNKPIEYFENMMGHDTDAIITIIGNGQIDDVEEQYLW